MVSEKFKYLYFLTKIKNLGNIRIKNLVNQFSDPEEIFRLSKNQLRRVEGFDERTSDSIIHAGKSFSEYEQKFQLLWKTLTNKGIKYTTLFSDDYPKNLKKIYDAPVILYYLGELSPNDKFSISVVGTRSPTIYGKTICEKIVGELSKLGIMTISGMARGIDSIVHQVSTKNNEKTYAVLGSGVDVIYPPENRILYEKIKNNGAVISEYEPGSDPDRVNFPKRNRIISGIGLGTLIIETPIKGGSLITAEFALDQNKEIFAIPGNISSRKSDGTNELIKKGSAKLVMTVDDILNELSYSLKPFLKKEGKENELQVSVELDIFEKKLYDVLNDEPVHIDKINEITGLSISDCLVGLLSLEFKNLIKQLPGKYFVRM